LRSDHVDGKSAKVAHYLHDAGRCCGAARRWLNSDNVTIEIILLDACGRTNPPLVLPISRIDVGIGASADAAHFVGEVAGGGGDMSFRAIPERDRSK
jgi:hypothetical protein